MQAKYKLIADLDSKDQEEMTYCSKCAINLLQQGFKVEEIKPSNHHSSTALNLRKGSNTMNYMLSSNGGQSTAMGSSRLQEMRSFEQKLNDIENNINKSLNEDSQEFQSIQ